MMLQDMIIKRTCHCPYCTSLSYQVMYTLKGGALHVEGQCARCQTTGSSFSYQPLRSGKKKQTGVIAVEL